MNKENYNNLRAKYDELSGIFCDIIEVIKEKVDTYNKLRGIVLNIVELRIQGTSIAILSKTFKSQENSILYQATCKILDNRIKEQSSDLFEKNARQVQREMFLKKINETDSQLRKSHLILSKKRDILEEMGQYETKLHKLQIRINELKQSAYQENQTITYLQQIIQQINFKGSVWPQQTLNSHEWRILKKIARIREKIARIRGSKLELEIQCRELIDKYLLMEQNYPQLKTECSKLEKECQALRTKRDELEKNLHVIDMGASAREQLQIPCLLTIEIDSDLLNAHDVKKFPAFETDQDWEEYNKTHDYNLGEQLNDCLTSLIRIDFPNLETVSRELDQYLDFLMHNFECYKGTIPESLDNIALGTELLETYAATANAVLNTVDIESGSKISERVSEEQNNLLNNIERLPKLIVGKNGICYAEQEFQSKDNLLKKPIIAFGFHQEKLQSDPLSSGADQQYLSGKHA